mgnify:CR=1 FL=1
MKKIIENFYIFSKLSTSIVLFLVLFFMGYLLYSSYSSINNESSKNDEEILSIVSLIKENQSQILALSNEFNTKFKNLEKISEILNNNDFDKEGLNLKIEDINNNINILKNDLIGIQDKIEKVSNNPVAYNDDSSTIEDIKKILFIKFLNNSNLDEELNLLSEIISNENAHYLDKILILKNKLDFDYQNLTNEYKSIRNLYLKENIVDKKNNYLVKIIIPIIDIKPSNKSSFRNKDLSIFKDTKELLNKKKFSESIEKLKSLKFQEEYLDDFIYKVSIYADFKNTLELL